jgi:N-acetylmuramoyl-L-alanine amidase
MMTFLTETHTRLTLPASAALLGLFVLFGRADSASQSQTTTYTMHSAAGRRNLVVRTGGATPMIALDQLTGTFGLKFTEDRSANGLVISTRGDRIFAFPGQSFVRAAGRVVALDGPVQRDRNTWLAPLDFLTKALGPAIGETIVIRRSSRLVLVGNVRVPEVGARIERTSAGARVVIAVQPATPARVVREGNRLTVRFEANALDPAAIGGFIPEFVTAAKVDGTAIIFDLGPSAVSHRVEDNRAAGTLAIEVFPAPVAPPKPRPTPPPPPTGPPQVDLPQSGIRTVVIDPGHGGDDGGAEGAGGAKEKDVTMLMARRLKATIEGRLGLRTLLTRDGDETVSLDRRTEMANNNKADVFVSLHANWSARAALRGIQIYTQGLDEHRGAGAAQIGGQRRTVPVVGGGSRVIEPVPWHLAQLPFVDQSATLGAVLTRHFAERSVLLSAKPAIQGPMRILMGANMPAVLIELGFLSNAEDEKALGSVEWQSSVIDGIVAALSEVRRGLPASAPMLESR